MAEPTAVPSRGLTVRGRRLISALVLAALVVVAIIVIARRDTPLSRESRAARAAIDQGRPVDALAHLDAWIRSRPDSAEAQFLKARAEFSLGHLPEAMQCLDRAEQLGHDARPLYRLRALVFTQAGLFIRAEPILLNLLNEATEPDPPLLEALARVYLETYRLEMAGKVIQKWIADSPRDPKPFLWQTEIDARLEEHNPQVEEQHFREALDRDPGLDRARLGLARALAKNRRDDEAIREFDIYIAANPDDPRGLLGLGELRLKRGELDAASSLIDRALELEPASHDATRQRASLDILRGDTSAALVHLTAAIESDPLDLDSLYQRMLIYGRLDRKQEAQADKDRVDKLRADQLEVVQLRDRMMTEPDRLEHRLKLASWMLEHGRDDQAIRWLRNILASQPRNPEANRLLADYHERRGESGLANHYRLLGETARPSQ
ncbi:tetratricopeptide repeat protein [Aquisphaera insulae]|uniref:tetratricopeptide repeat protein n=1 Tax=Aquisphaera insulae TaxID=2712864 RepID=UPI0013ECB592|nr:tetratricopeptide repeat protein [Aquisphaera insulae]